MLQTGTDVNDPIKPCRSRPRTHGGPKQRAISVIAAALTMAASNGCSGSSTYTDPSNQTNITFGVHSHWIQPWRGYLETVPASWFLNGVGVVYNGFANPDLVFQHLVKNGIKLTRIEIGWGTLDYYTETLNDAGLHAELLACKTLGIRPVILLNANQQGPCPLLIVNKVVAARAPAGSTTVELVDTGGLIVNYSGLNNITQPCAAEAIITRINGQTITISKPLQSPIEAGQTVRVATLKYRPFSPPGTTDYNNTVSGWQKYVGQVNAYVSGILGAGSFDLEIWNELSFDSQFLYINHYYANAPYNYGAGSETDIWSNLTQATADYVNAHAAAFTGVEIGDGFASTIPWPSSSDLDPRINAICKHPYPRFLNYPAQEQPGDSLNAQMQVENPGGWVPAYHVSFPEYGGTALQTEHVLRDSSPITTDIYGDHHGRYARVINGQVIPCSEWITEIGYSPAEDGITDPEAALTLKAKTTARFFCFFLNKGVRKVLLFATASGDMSTGIVQDNFNAYASANAAYPADDAAYTSPSLLVTQRIIEQMSRSLDNNLVSTRNLEVTSITDAHNHYQFTGNGTAVHPPLYDRDVLTILPFQVNSTRFVIPYYVMTRDVRKGFAPEQFTIGLKGLDAANAQVSAYDPINDTNAPITVESRSGDTIVLTLAAADYPYLLIING